MTINKRLSPHMLTTGLLLIFISSCALLKVGLTQDLIDKYIKTYTSLQKAGITIQKEEIIEDSKMAYTQATRIIKKNGFRNYLHFARVHTKIMKGLLLLESQKQVNGLVKEYAPELKDWQKILDDPSIPAKEKTEMRKKLSQLLESYRKNEEYNDPVKILSRWVISQEALILIQKNEEKLHMIILPRDIKQHQSKLK